MKLSAISFAVIVLVAQAAQAGHLSFGGGGPGLGGHHGGFGGGEFGGGFGGFGRGGFGFDTQQQQTRFEDKFEDLQIDYDTGLAEIEDFYSTDDYADVVDGVERLVDRYDWFLTGVERSIDRIGDFIEVANEELTYYDELLADYQERDDLSEERLARIIDRLTSVQEHLTTKIDLLTEKQTTLSDSLGSYQTFGTDLSAYLSQIVTAGGGTTTTDGEETAAAVLAAINEEAVALRSVAAVTLGDDGSMCEPPQLALATVAPEPGAQCLGLIAISLMALWRRPRGRIARLGGSTRNS
jgi:hypothetical protein